MEHDATLSQCAGCKRQTTDLLNYAEWKGVRHCTLKDSDGNSRPSLEPFFSAGRNVCYPCHSAAVRGELRLAHRGYS